MRCATVAPIPFTPARPSRTAKPPSRRWSADSSGACRSKGPTGGWTRWVQAVHPGRPAGHSVRIRRFAEIRTFPAEIVLISAILLISARRRGRTTTGSSTASTPDACRSGRRTSTPWRRASATSDAGE